MVTIALGVVGPIYVVKSPIVLTSAFFLWTSGLRLAFSNLDAIPTSPAYLTGSAKNFEPRIPDSSDVVVFNSQSKIRITTPENGECLLTEQALFNPN